MMSEFIVVRVYIYVQVIMLLTKLLISSKKFSCFCDFFIIVQQVCTTLFLK